MTNPSENTDPHAHTHGAQALRDGDRGLLLIDVDGPLNPYGAKPWRRPEGYASYRLTRDGRFLTGKEFRKNKGMVVWLNPDHGPKILDLARRAKLRPVWATTWLELANTHIAPAIGLPALPVISYPATDLAHSMWVNGGDWKWNGVAEWAREVPLAWWDDEHDDTAFRMDKAAFLALRAPTPTLLCHVDPAKGLLDEHFDAVEQWAAGLPPRTAP